METIPSHSIAWPLLLLTGLSVSIGWGVRGQFGHEYGAALAGALGGMTVALLGGRQDWLPRIPYFAFLGAVGFAFGGAMSYMKTVAYIHSSDSATVLYGFACLFLLGGLWAAPAGAGLGLAACLDREQLTRLFIPVSAIFLAWHFSDTFRGPYRTLPLVRYLGDYGFTGLIALAVVALMVLIRPSNWGDGAFLIVCMAVGSWIGHLLLITLLRLDMNPPRGDTWASNAGLVAGILFFSWRRRLGGVAFATLGGLLLGGMGFALGGAVKLLVMSSGYDTNWHSILEQSQGFFLGIALAITMGILAARTPALADQTPVRRWTEVFSVVFVLWLLPYLNLRRSPGEWVNEIAGLKPEIYGIRINGDFVFSRGFLGWFDMVFLAIAIAMIFLLALHLRRPLPLIPTSWMGKGQLFYLVFLWTTVTINFMDVLPRFTPIRLVTEWFITVNAAACTILLVIGCFLLGAPSGAPAGVPSGPGASPSPRAAPYAPAIRNLILAGLAGVVVVSFAGWAVKRAIYGDKFTGGGGTDQIRFGPHNTNSIR
ncbi:MAG: hypothetical protein ACLQU1_13795 [Bryobacteraceae bacterium]